MAAVVTSAVAVFHFANRDRVECGRTSEREAGGNRLALLTRHPSLSRPSGLPHILKREPTPPGVHVP